MHAPGRYFSVSQIRPRITRPLARAFIYCSPLHPCSPTCDGTSLMSSLPQCPSLLILYDTRTEECSAQGAGCAVCTFVHALNAMHRCTLAPPCPPQNSLNVCTSTEAPASPTMLNQYGTGEGGQVHSMLLITLSPGMVWHGGTQGSHRCKYRGRHIFCT
jgi:hypothetical protein